MFFFFFFVIFLGRGSSPPWRDALREKFYSFMEEEGKKKKGNTKRRFLKAGTCPTASLRPAAAACFGDWSTKLVERGVPVLPPHAGSTHGTPSCAPQAVLSQLWEFWGGSPPLAAPLALLGGAMETGGTRGRRCHLRCGLPLLSRVGWALLRVCPCLWRCRCPPRLTQPGFPLFIADCN